MVAEVVMEGWVPPRYEVHPDPYKGPREKKINEVQKSKSTACVSRNHTAEAFEKNERLLFYERAKLFMQTYAQGVNSPYMPTAHEPLSQCLVKYNVRLKTGQQPISISPFVFVLGASFDLSAYMDSPPAEANGNLLKALAEHLDYRVLNRSPGPEVREGMIRLLLAAGNMRANQGLDAWARYPGRGVFREHSASYTYEYEGQQGTLTISSAEGTPQLGEADFFMDAESRSGMDGILVSHPELVMRVCVQIEDSCGDVHWMQLAPYDPRFVELTYASTVGGSTKVGYEPLVAQAKLIDVDSKKTHKRKTVIAPYSEAEMYEMILNTIHVSIENDGVAIGDVLELMDRWANRDSHAGDFGAPAIRDTQTRGILDRILGEDEPPIKIVFYSADGLGILSVRFNVKSRSVRTLMRVKDPEDQEPRTFYLYVNYPYVMRNLERLHVPRRSVEQSENTRSRNVERAEALVFYDKPIPAQAKVTNARDKLAQRRRDAFIRDNPDKDPPDLDHFVPLLFFVNDPTDDPDDPYVIYLPLDTGDLYYDYLDNQRMEFEREASIVNKQNGGETFYDFRSKLPPSYQKKVHAFRLYVGKYDVARQTWQKRWGDLIEREMSGDPPMPFMFFSQYRAIRAQQRDQIPADQDDQNNWPDHDEYGDPGFGADDDTWGITDPGRHHWGDGNQDQYDWGDGNQDQYDWGDGNQDRHHWGDGNQDQYDWGDGNQDRHHWGDGNQDRHNWQDPHQYDQNNPADDQSVRDAQIQDIRHFAPGITSAEIDAVSSISTRIVNVLEHPKVVACVRFIFWTFAEYGLNEDPTGDEITIFKIFLTRLLIMAHENKAQDDDNVNGNLFEAVKAYAPLKAHAFHTGNLRTKLQTLAKVINDWKWKPDADYVMDPQKWDVLHPRQRDVVELKRVIPDITKTEIKYLRGEDRKHPAVVAHIREALRDVCGYEPNDEIEQCRCFTIFVKMWRNRAAKAGVTEDTGVIKNFDNFLVEEKDDVDLMKIGKGDSSFKIHQLYRYAGRFVFDFMLRQRLRERNERFLLARAAL